jgi:hypothetical protein
MTQYIFVKIKRSRDGQRSTDRGRSASKKLNAKDKQPLIHWNDFQQEKVD